MAKKISKRKARDSAPPKRRTTPAKTTSTAAAPLVPGRGEGESLIVGVGTSASGLKAFTDLLGNLPEDSGLTFVLIQRSSPSHEGQMRELVSKACRMPVSEVQGQTRAEANHVYVVPPRCNLGIFDGVLHAQPLPDISQNSNQNRAAQDIENLCQALEAETRRSLEAQRRLDRANAEFEAFISTAAHNLREHLRDVTSFTQLMAETYAGRLGSEADLFLERIQEGAEAMQSVLTHIVDYWATGTGDRQFSEIDMEGVLRQAILCTDQEITQRGAVVTHDPLPRVCGDFGALIKVLHHLIRNAVEYCATPAPRIHISSRRIEPNWVISVQDNGPGIDPAFHERIFEAFKRLHGKEHPGTGLGLAFCKKTLEWHGGRMWMESTPGAGSTFYFSLPPAD